MQKPIYFSIIVPTYNRADLIVNTLKSLQNQEYKNYEIIVVDDGSNDNTTEVVKNIADERITYVKKTNGERAAARNFGAAIAKGDYVNFFDSDDIALPHHLSESVKIINQNNFPEWVYVAYALADSKRNIIQAQNKFVGKTINNQMVRGNVLGCNSVFVRRDIFLLHKFNEDRVLSASEDYELWCRLTARYPLYYSNLISSLIIQHDQRSVNTITGAQLINRISALKKYLKQDKEVVKYFGKNFSKIEMHLFGYISLHLSEYRAFKTRSLFYLSKSIAMNPVFITKRMFYAIIRNIFFRW